MVNFNHPFAGKEVTYEIKVIKKVTDLEKQVNSYLELSLNIPKAKTEIKEDKAIVTLPMELPPAIQDLLSKKLLEVVKLKEVTFQAEKKPEAPKK